jgi:tetratricopeptide (TPR) repeat protein
MKRTRLLGWIGVLLSAALAIVGFLVFIGGIVIEIIDTSPIEGWDLSPTITIALVGLFLSGLMVMFGFGLVMVLLAMQSRKQAPGYGDAYRFMETMQFQQAIPVLERAIESGHETSDVLALLTSAYAHTGQLAKAQATADKAVRLYPDDPGAYMTLANGYRLQASYEEAARALQTAVSLAPEQVILWAELGFLHILAGDDNAALKAFKETSKIPMPPMYSVRVYYHLAQAYKISGDAEEAALATAKMMSARNGIEAWKPLQETMAGTAYGQALYYEIANIEQAIFEADSASLRS